MSELTRLLGYLQSDPSNLRLRADVFDKALAAGELGTAQEQTTWVLTRSPADLGWKHRLALLDIAQEQWDEARLLLQSLIHEGQTSPAIAYNIAYVDSAQGRLDQAVARLEPLIEEHFAQVPEALTLLLRSLHRQGEIEAGLAWFIRFADRVTSAQTLGAASLLAIDGSRVQDSVAWADRALAQDAHQREALVAKGTALLGQRDARGALRYLEPVLQRYPDDGRTLSAIGMAELLNTNLATARDAFVRAVGFMPLHIGTWHGLGWCEIFRKDLDAAQCAFEAALALDRNFGESHGAVAAVLALQGRASQAEEAIRRALKLDPAGLSARYAQAVLSGAIRDPKKFARMARAAMGQRHDADGGLLADIVLRRH